MVCLPTRPGSSRSYTVSANACHLRGILSGPTMLGDIQAVYVATFAVSIGGVKAALNRA
jgi:hypothetical protein